MSEKEFEYSPKNVELLESLFFKVLKSGDPRDPSITDEELLAFKDSPLSDRYFVHLNSIVKQKYVIGIKSVKHLTERNRKLVEQDPSSFKGYESIIEVLRVFVSKKLLCFDLVKRGHAPGSLEAFKASDISTRLVLDRLLHNELLLLFYKYPLDIPRTALKNRLEVLSFMHLFVEKKIATMTILLIEPKSHL